MSMSSAWPPATPHPSPAATDLAPGLAARGMFVYLPSLRMGGTECSMVRLAAGFAARGVAVTLVVQDDHDRELAVPPGVVLRTLGARRSLGAMPGLWRLLRRHRPAWLLTALPHSNLVGVLASLLARVDCRVVVSEHAPPRLQHAHTGGWRYHCLAPLVRWAYPRAAAIVAVSEGVRIDLAGLGRRLLAQVIHNPVLGADWQARAAEPAGHPWLDEPGGEVVLSVSRLSVEKNLPLLLGAFAMVSAERPAARLLIAGAGPERGDLERCVYRLGLGAKVQLVGMVSNPLAWMRRARVFVLASAYEGFGNVLVEALAAGTQVVSTDCPVGPREVLEGGRLGRLVPVGDLVALAGAITAVLGGERDACGQADAQSLAARYTQDRAAAAYLSLFAAIEARSASRIGTQSAAA